MVTLSLKEYEFNTIINALEDYAGITDTDRVNILMKFWKLCKKGIYKDNLTHFLVSRGALKPKRKGK